MLAGQGPNERLPAASAAAWAPRSGPRPGPLRVRRACVSARGGRPAQCACAAARAAASPPPPSLPGICECACAPNVAAWRLDLQRTVERRPLRQPWETCQRAEGRRPVQAKCRWEAGVGAGLSFLWWARKGIPREADSWVPWVAGPLGMRVLKGPPFRSLGLFVERQPRWSYILQSQRLGT